ncbi:hypothetical protein [uncultured Sphingomonas sp.]|uniref:hypothetical protein n=1 Tax=uncultured Sphingomonas sp. TaxID=158754 RepID=UPI0025F1A872|nr:hypothetical protein [uncultured Sphingomonas sp.]
MRIDLETLYEPPYIDVRAAKLDHWRHFDIMSADTKSEPDPKGRIIFVGQDRAGHWLVQDNRQTLEGRFISRGAAMHFAQAEREIYGAALEMATAPLTPLVPFEPARQDECVLPRAA